MYEYTIPYSSYTCIRCELQDECIELTRVDEVEVSPACWCVRRPRERCDWWRSYCPGTTRSCRGRTRGRLL